MSPDEREIEDLRSGLAGRYRAGSIEAPPAHLDAAILAAARREIVRSRLTYKWQLPASIAAVLVIGVSLALITTEIEDPLPPLDQSSGVATDEAGPAVNAPAMKQESPARSAPRSAIERDSPPSRERSVRSERKADVRQDSAAGFADAPTEAPSIAAPAPAPVLRQFEVTAPSESVAGKKRALADTANETSAVATLRNEAVPSSSPPSDAAEQWLKKIGDLLRDGKTAQARGQLAEFRKRYPDLPLPETLRELEAAMKRNMQ